ncbi:electron transfer flavoprotein subunit alpha/FixB family protein [Ferroplasma acidiphilum]|uniref:Electron transfer flavoprotein subunit alpha/FixB family protein n=1 Tax=Ferroplasma acidiphilum TaxID=74969 RepID=A0A7K4FLV7_9ARCH|nr:electron transfer flavoprotein subunit alpha/FixB family protein [Ferroplasma acidiphilum]NOL59915.1 electron transfer flavoprotein subunit alpha/FixB family protein [Ferroplasma acidiphilum]
MKALVFSDEPKNAMEIITYLRGKMDIDVISQENKELPEYGANTVYFYSNGFVDNLGKFLADYIGKNNYDFIFISSTNMGRELAGILSFKLKMKCMPEIFSFEHKEKNITRRFYHGGKTVVEEESNFKMFTVSPGICEAEKTDKKSEVKNLTLEKSDYKIVDVKSKKTAGTDIRNAKVIVSIGRGLGSQENIEKVMPLVDVLHAEISGSRPVCLDYKWLSEDKQVGLSGKKVRPDFYIALGISGQIQHIAGIRGSKTIIAINKDKSAPIFEECDYGLVGDLFTIVPQLVEKLKN